MINWVYFPKSSPPPDFGVLIVAHFEEVADAIDSSKKADQHSDTVMVRLRPSLEKLGFRVEKGKSSDDKIVVPVLFGRKGKVLKCFNADAHAATCAIIFLAGSYPAGFDTLTASVWRADSPQIR